jgi:hypothetical protein
MRIALVSTLMTAVIVTGLALPFSTVRAQSGMYGPGTSDTLFSDDIYGDTTYVAGDTVETDSISRRALHVVAREHEFDTQIRYSLITMLMVFLMMGTVQTFNPR